MGKDAHPEGEACCYACERWSSGEAPVVERTVLEVPVPKRTRLIVRQGRSGTTVVEYVPDKETIWIGRGSQNDIVLDSDVLSRRQTYFTFRDGAVFVSDGGSACGTFLDGQLIETARVGAGSVVSFGNFEVVIATE
jgi:pSer/pThr/pTyr-binding forkhead associated (FHA) protein